MEGAEAPDVKENLKVCLQHLQNLQIRFWISNPNFDLPLEFVRLSFKEKLTLHQIGHLITILFDGHYAQKSHTMDGEENQNRPPKKKTFPCHKPNSFSQHGGPYKHEPFFRIEQTRKKEQTKELSKRRRVLYLDCPSWYAFCPFHWHTPKSTTLLCRFCSTGAISGSEYRLGHVRHVGVTGVAIDI